MPSQPDKEKIAGSFSRSAASYDSQAALQRDMGERLLTMLKGEYKNILDIGCGTGELTRALGRCFPSAKVQGIDIASGMVEAAKRTGGVEFALGDGEKTSFPSASFDLIVSCAALHWMDLPAFSLEAARLAKPGAALVVATFGSQTMKELRELGLRVNSFPDKVAIQFAFTSEFTEIKILEETRQLKFSSLKEFVLGLRLLGGRQPLEGIGKNPFFLRKKLNKPFSVTYQVIYLSAVKKN